MPAREATGGAVELRVDATGGVADRERVGILIRVRRVEAVDCVSRTQPVVAQCAERLERLVVGFKRAANILKGIDEEKLPDAHKLDWSGTEKTEKALHKAVLEAEQALAAARKKKDYPAMLEHLLELREPIDRFFDDVLVMTDNAAEKNRRLALLAEARELFHHFFDPARIVIEGEAAQ